VSGYTTSSFTDVANTSPAMPYIEWAVQNKIVQEIGNNQFGPDQLISRQDMAVMMVNYAKISADAKDAVKAIQQAGVINGKTVTGWWGTDANKYWFDDKGVMAAGKWVQISGKWYYFYSDGKLAVNTTLYLYQFIFYLAVLYIMCNADTKHLS